MPPQGYHPPLELLPTTSRFENGDLVEAMGLEPTNLLTASQALYQLSYAPNVRGGTLAVGSWVPDSLHLLTHLDQDARAPRLPWCDGSGV